MVVTETKDYEPLIHKFYAQDKELISKYHIISGATMEECAQHTIEVFKSSVSNFRFFKLSTEKDIIGYFGSEITDKNMLTGFFISPKYRRKGYVRKFWKIVDNHFGGTYFAGIHAKNERAARFLNKKGELVVKGVINNQDALVFKIN